MSILKREDNVTFKKFWIDQDSLYILTTDDLVIKRHKSITARLSKATLKQLKNFEILGKGEGIHWPDIDEDLSAAFLIYPEEFGIKIKKAS